MKKSFLPKKNKIFYCAQKKKKVGGGKGGGVGPSKEEVIHGIW